ncbi:Clp protease N-terminal domain-containing protein [Algibacter sp. Ld11]|uniref:Clp protease N-terminal domain-containing protein n=1 Tax=Algibacter sp. Ld11 TaxID=649150 RepID=UPI003870075A
MNKEINFKEIIEILTRHLKAIISIKSEFVELKDYEKVSKFRDYEKEIETQLELLKGNKNAIKKPLHIKEQQVSKVNFSNESKKVLKSINKENALIFTKDLTLSILNNGNSELSDIFLKLGVEINDLKNDLKNSSIKDDIASKEHPLFTLKTLRAIDTSFLEVKLTKEKEVTPYTILLGILRNKNDFTTKTLNTYGITYKNLFTEIKKRPTHSNI